MSCSIMQGFISDEIDKEHAEVFSEGTNASGFIRRYLPKSGDSEFYASEDGTWLELKNKNGRLWIEIGEGAA